jgi:predicted nucleic acid-binding Zn ribbon protein
MFCINCGKELPDESRFCSNCGEKNEKMELSFAEPQRRERHGFTSFWFVFLLIGYVFSGLFIALSYGYSQTNTILDYFQFSNANYWVYELRGSMATDEDDYGNVKVIYSVVNYTFDLDGSPLVYINRIFENEEQYWTAELYKVDIKSGCVFKVASRSWNDSYNQEHEPYPIKIAYFGKNWRRETVYPYSRSLDEYKTYTGNINFNNMQFDDCIILENKTFEVSDVSKILKTVYREYYARNIGLVYTDWQTADDISNGKGPWWNMRLLDLGSLN